MLVDIFFSRLLEYFITTDIYSKAVVNVKLFFEK